MVKFGILALVAQILSLAVVQRRWVGFQWGDARVGSLCISLRHRTRWSFCALSIPFFVCFLSRTLKWLLVEIRSWSGTSNVSILCDWIKGFVSDIFHRMFRGVMRVCCLVRNLRKKKFTRTTRSRNLIQNVPFITTLLKAKRLRSIPEKTDLASKFS